MKIKEFDWLLIKDIFKLSSFKDSANYAFVCFTGDNFLYIHKF